MKAYIGPRLEKISMHRLFNKWIELNHKKESQYFVEESEYTNFDRIIENFLVYLDERFTKKLNVIMLRPRRKVKIQLQDFDTDPMFIISSVALPLLERVKRQGIARPFVPNEDVPEFLHADIDPNQHELTDREELILQKRWRYVLSQMISAFRSFSDYEYSLKVGPQDEKIGLMLFAKYAHALETYRDGVGMEEE